MSITVIEGDFNGVDGHYTLVASRFNEPIVESLVKGAIDALQRCGVNSANIRLLRVPGAFEIPLAVQQIASQNHDDAIIALGAVIRGSTPHFEYVSSATSSGISQVALNHSIPVINGILTTNTIEQAMERAGTKAGNKGTEAAMCAMEMVSVLRQVET